MTQKEFNELIELKQEIFGDSMFVVFDHHNPQELRYNDLIGQWLQLPEETKRRLNFQRGKELIKQAQQARRQALTA